MTAPDSVNELVAKFAQHRKEYQTHKNETELRREFLDPFFEALGWDVFNKKSYSERFKEVLHEASVEVEGKAKGADYAFLHLEFGREYWNFRTSTKSVVRRLTSTRQY
jgi:hypothetical protein